jgi:DNA phosphorothioation-associated putative methyltransferase
MENSLAIPRHKTAIHRTDLSRPLKYALRDGLLGCGTSLFDYGCGHGHDLDLCRSRGIAAGWDPVFRPDVPLRHADVVNLGFVLDVIEDTAARAAALRNAWRLAGRLLVVAAGIHAEHAEVKRVTFCSACAVAGDQREPRRCRPSRPHSSPVAGCRRGRQRPGGLR